MYDIYGYRKDSFDRFGDDLTELILSFLWFEDKIRLECVSKQWKRCVFQKQFVIELNFFRHLKSCSGEVDNSYSNNYPHFNPFSRTGLGIEFHPFFDRIEKWIDFYPFGLILAPEQDSGLKAYSSALLELVRIVFKQMSLL